MRIRNILIIILFLIFGLSPEAAGRKPVIGIAPGYRGAEYSILRRTYTDAIRRAGGIPFILPQVDDASGAEEILRHVDGVVFSGGEDLAPGLYSERVLNGTVEVDEHRDTIDLLYARAALSRRLPVLGICRGEQLLNVVLGGSLYQDLPSQKPGGISHRQSASGEVPTHYIVLEGGSKLHEIMRRDTLWVNTFHHQAVKTPAPGLTITARAEDGTVEAFEMIGQRRADSWVLAVQFHPEMLLRSDDGWLPLFRAFIRAARGKRR